MALVAEYLLACEELPLVTVAASAPGMELRVEVGQPNQGIYPPFFVRATGEAFERLESAFEAAAFVRQYALLDRDGRTCRYKVVPAAGMVEQLADVVEDPTELRSLAANESVVEGIRVTPDGWIQTRWFAGRDAFDEYRSFWNGNGVSLSVRRLSRTDVDAGPERRLTDRQREALVTAYEMGYFEIPRATSLAEVADELGISAPALSERLRRAHARVTEALLAAGGELNDLTD